MGTMGPDINEIVLCQENEHQFPYKASFEVNSYDRVEDLFGDEDLLLELTT